MTLQGLRDRHRLVIALLILNMNACLIVLVVDSPNVAAAIFDPGCLRMRTSGAVGTFDGGRAARGTSGLFSLNCAVSMNFYVTVFALAALAP